MAKDNGVATGGCMFLALLVLGMIWASSYDSEKKKQADAAAASIAATAKAEQQNAKKQIELSEQKISDDFTSALNRECDPVTSGSSDGELFEPQKIGAVKVGDPSGHFEMEFGPPTEQGDAAVLHGIGDAWPGFKYLGYRRSKVIVIVAENGTIANFYLGRTPGDLKHPEAVQFRNDMKDSMDQMNRGLEALGKGIREGSR